MIVRILGYGQWHVDQDTVDALNELDDDVMEAADRKDERAFRSALISIHEMVKERGTAVGDDELAASDLILPDEDSTIDEVKALLDDDGLIPG